MSLPVLRGIRHVALRVTDVSRSRALIEKAQFVLVRLTVSPVTAVATPSAAQAGRRPPLSCKKRSSAPCSEGKSVVA